MLKSFKQNVFVVTSAFEVSFLRAWCRQRCAHTCVQNLRIERFAYFTQKKWQPNRDSKILGCARSRIPELLGLIAELPALKEIEIEVGAKDLASYNERYGSGIRRWYGEELEPLVHDIVAKSSVQTLRISSRDLKRAQPETSSMDNMVYRHRIHKLRESLLTTFSKLGRRSLQVILEDDLHISSQAVMASFGHWAPFECCPDHVAGFSGAVHDPMTMHLGCGSQWSFHL